MPPLPQEIIETVVHALSLIAGSDTDAQKALHTCLLVSKAFYYPCCRETFSSVHLRFYPTHKSAENCRVVSLLHLVNANPYLANTVNTLVLELCTHRRAPPSASGSDEELCSLIDTLGSRSLNTLEINGKGVYDGWMSSGGRLLPTLLHLRGRPSLRKLILRTIGDVPRALVTGDPDKDNLEHLLIENVRFTTSFPKLPVRGLPFAASPPIEPSGISPIVHATAHSLSLPLSSLKHLDVTDPEKFAAFLMRHERHSPYANLSFPNLQSLSVNGSSMYLSIDRLKRLIHACSSIERLSLRGNFELPDTFPEMVDLSTLPALRHLHLDSTTNLSLWELKRHHILTSISKVIATSPNACLLQTLSLDLGWWFITDNQESQLSDPTTEWSVLDQLLVSNRFPFLRKVTVSIIAQYTRTPAYLNGLVNSAILQHNMHVRVQGIFPLLTAKGQTELDICFKVEGTTESA